MGLLVSLPAILLTEVQVFPYRACLAWPKVQEASTNTAPLPGQILPFCSPRKAPSPSPSPHPCITWHLNCRHRGAQNASCNVVTCLTACEQHLQLPAKGAVRMSVPWWAAVWKSRLLNLFHMIGQIIFMAPAEGRVTSLNTLYLYRNVIDHCDLLMCSYVYAWPSEQSLISINPSSCMCVCMHIVCVKS